MQKRGKVFVALTMLVFVLAFSVPYTVSAATVLAHDETTLRGAISAATEATQIDFQQDITLATPLLIDSPHSITLNGAGFALNGAMGQDILQVKTAVALTNITVTHGGGNGRGISVQPGGQLTLKDGATVTGNSISGNSETGTDNKGAGVYVDGGALILEGSSLITGNVATGVGSFGGGVYVTGGGSLTMNGGNITSNSTAASGGGVLLNNGSFALNGGSVDSNTSGFGAGVSLYENGTLTMSGGNISNNIADSSGGGVHVYLNSQLVMNDGSIDGNMTTSTSGFGGGVDVNVNSTFQMNSGSIDGNESYYGGGVNVSGQFELNNGTIASNRAVAYSSDGGGVRVGNGGAFTMNGGLIQLNTANAGINAFGGGVSVNNSASFTLNNGTITDNTASSGGGVSFNGANSTFTMAGGSIAANTADNQGGGVLVNGANTTNFMLMGGAITGNTAANGGAGVYWRSGLITVGGSPMVGQTTEDNGLLRLLATQALTIDTAGLSSANFNIDLLSADKAGTVIATKADGSNATPEEAGYFWYNGPWYCVEDGVNVVLSAVPPGAPGAPQNVRANLGNGQATLTWQVPLSDGGSPIMGYQVSLDGGANWVAASGNMHHVFTGLANGTQYTFLVRAFNDVGAGPNADTVGTPQAPATQQVQQAESTQVVQTGASPQTGDNGGMALWAVLACAAVLALVGAWLLVRRHKTRG